MLLRKTKENHTRCGWQFSPEHVAQLRSATLGSRLSPPVGNIVPRLMSLARYIISFCDAEYRAVAGSRLEAQPTMKSAATKRTLSEERRGEERAAIAMRG